MGTVRLSDELATDRDNTVDDDDDNDVVWQDLELDKTDVEDGDWDEEGTTTNDGGDGTLARLLGGWGDDVALGGVKELRLGERLHLELSCGDPDAEVTPAADAEFADVQVGADEVGAAAVVVSGADTI